jgi:hypothetical protein
MRSTISQITQFSHFHYRILRERYYLGIFNRTSLSAWTQNSPCHNRLSFNDPQGSCAQTPHVQDSSYDTFEQLTTCSVILPQVVTYDGKRQGWRTHCEVLWANLSAQSIRAQFPSYAPGGSTSHLLRGRQDPRQILCASNSRTYFNLLTLLAHYPCPCDERSPNVEIEAHI